MPEEVNIRQMKKEDLSEVNRIEKLSFPNPWSSSTFSIELNKKGFTFYWVIECKGRLVGYAGYWKIKNEAHLVNLAIHPTFRRKGWGGKLLEHLLEDARSRGLTTVTLEARQSNLAAQKFYEKFGFKKMAIRPKYYSDTNEDAIIYWKKIKKSEEL